MKLTAFALLFFFTIALCGQQTIDLGQEVMGTFTSGDTECYELTINEAGDYILTYNLWDATMSVINHDQQEIFSDYMLTFEASPRSHELTFSTSGTHQICFSRGGETAMYQCTIVKKSIGPTDPITLIYGGYATRDLSVDGSAASYLFTGNENDKIRIGLSMIFAVNVKITAPSESILYDQSFETPPSDGLKLEFDLEESGDYLITITPLLTYLQFTVSIYIIEPVFASEILFDESYGGTLVNFGIHYYQFYAYNGDTLKINYDGSSEGITMEVITPGNEIITCNDSISEVHIDHTLNIEEEGTYVIKINSSLQGFSTFGLIVELKPEPYEGEKTEVPFGTYFDYEIPGYYVCSVPDELDQLFVILKKDYIYNDKTWVGFVSLKHGDEIWEPAYGSSSRHYDFIYQADQPEPGIYELPVFAETEDNEIKGSILFTGELPEAKINEWSSGVISRPNGSDWKMFDLDQQVDTLFIESEGFGLYSEINVTYNNINNYEQSWYFWNSDNQGYHIEGKIINALPGRYIIKYTDSAVLHDFDDNNSYNPIEDQSRTYMLYVGSAWSNNSGLLSLRNVSALELGTGRASITLSGSGLSSVSDVNLISEDEQLSIPLNIQSVTEDGQELVAGYDFAGVEPGAYFLEIVNPDTLIRYSKNIELIPLITASISSSMLTSDLYRLGRNQKCIVRIENNGTIDIPFMAGYFYSSSEQVSVLLTDTPGSEYEVDSINALLQDKVLNQMPFFVENLRVGEVADFMYNIYSSTLSAEETFKVGYLACVLNDSIYYSLQDTLATDWYDFLISSDITPASMKDYLEEISLTGFIEIWNSNVGGESKNIYKGDSNSIDETVIENGTEAFYSILDKLPGKTPFNIPYKIVRKGVDVAWNTTKKCCHKLQRIRDFLENQGNDDHGEDSDGIYKEEEKIKYPIQSTTPEDKYGPAGYGTENGKGYIDTLNQFEYQIDYWNKEDATAPAAIVYIRDTIDTDFDLKTLRFTEAGFLRWKMKLDGGQYFNVNIDCRPEMPYIVNVEGTVDHDTREVFWVHTTLDPETMELPDDPMSGFLPPIDSTGYQIGWVNYTIRPAGELKHGISFENQAFVNFDGVGPWGPAPPYGPYTSIFDFSSPCSYVEELDPVQTSLTFDIHIEAKDDESGIHHFDIYFSKDYSEPSLWESTTDTILEFSGEDGARYEFHSLAVDKVGNREEAKTTYDAFTEISLAQTGIDKPGSFDNCRLKIIPNPSDGIFRVELGTTPERGMLQIIDLTGRIKYNESYLSGEQINMDYLESGIYLLNFRSSTGRYYSKLYMK
ncbi:MAG: T9SS type A sorting domain-containing protein [Marinilabiliaceae bacterium]|jgi:hypothetical protein|nr:T9SS type A sorting domain-containing protein [Marinilabiliaceae bacterium]